MGGRSRDGGHLPPVGAEAPAEDLQEQRKPPERHPEHLCRERVDAAQPQNYPSEVLCSRIATPS